MKGIYFLIGIAIFVISALIFLNENSKFYEGFDSSIPTTDASGNPLRDASGNPITTSPKEVLKPGTCPPLTAYDPGSMMCLSASNPPVAPTCPSKYQFDLNVGKCRILPEDVCPPAYVYSGSLTNPTPDATCTLQSALNAAQAPGTTVADPSLGVVSNSNKQGYINAILNFSKQVVTLGGQSVVKDKLSPDDKTYLTELWTELPKVPTWVQGGAFP